MSMESTIFPSSLSRSISTPDPGWRVPSRHVPALMVLLESEPNPAIRRKISSLQQETHAELQFLGLTQLARDLALEDKAESSFRLLRFIQTALPEREPWAQGILRSAKEIENGIQGVGEHGQQELRLRHWLRAATDVSTLAAFSLGGALGECTEILSLSAFKSTAPSLLTRGALPQFFAKSAALAVEAPAIWTLRKGFSGASADASDLSGLKSLALNLAMLRGLSGNQALGFNKSPWVSSGVLALGSSVGRYFSGLLGWLPRIDASGAVRESLEFLLASGAGARVSGALFGKSLADLRARVTVRDLASPPVYGGFPKSGQGLPQTANATASLASRSSGNSNANPVPQIQLALSTGSPSSAQGFVLRRLAQRLRNELGPRLKLSPSSMKNIVQAFQSTPLASDEALQRYGNFLLRTKIESGLNDEGLVEKSEILERAVLGFAFANRLDPMQRAAGSYYEHLVQLAFRQSLVPSTHEIFDDKHQQRFDELVRIVGLVRKTEALESYLEVPKIKFSGMSDAQLERLKSLAIDSPAKANLKPVLLNYLSLQPGPRQQPFNGAPESNVIKSGLDGAEIITPWNVENALAGLEYFCLQNPVGSVAQGQLIEGIKIAIANSQAWYFILDRLFKTVYLQQGREKLFELGDWPAAIYSHRLKKQIMLDELTADFIPAAKAINGSIHTGYLNDLPLAEKIVRISTLAPIYRDAKRSRENRKDTIARAAQLLGERERILEQQQRDASEANFGNEEVLEMLYLHATPLATQARNAILQHEVALEIASPARVKELWTRIDHSGKHDEPPPGFYVPEHLSPSGKPLIVIRRLDPEMPRNDKIAHAVWLAAYVVHEFEHHVHRNQLDLNDPRQATLAEMRAQVETLFYHLRQGNDAEWEQMLRLSPYGLGIYLRSNAELEIFPSTHLVVDDRP